MGDGVVPEPGVEPGVDGWHCSRERQKVICTTAPAGPSALNSVASDGPLLVEAWDIQAVVGDPRAPYARFVRMQVRNAGPLPLHDIYYVVLAAPFGARLLNADGGPGGEGALLTIPPEDLGPDGRLSPDESNVLRLDIGYQAQPSACTGGLSTRYTAVQGDGG